MDRDGLKVKSLIAELQAIVEMDNSLGVEYYNIPGGVENIILLGAVADRDKVKDRRFAEAVGMTTAERESLETGAAGAEENQVEKGFESVSIPGGNTGVGAQLQGDPEKIRVIEAINKQVAACTGCVLAQARKNPVQSEGSVAARVAFVALAPGREEDNAGRNFCGAAGQLIIDIIEKGMKISRREVYLSSIIKCRPPGNREPLAIEIEACRQYFEAEMAAVQPEVIIAVGGAAASILTGDELPIEQTRGMWYEFAGIPLMPIYHPAFLLRQRRKLGHSNEFVRRTWEDIQQVMRRLNTGKA